MTSPGCSVGPRGDESCDQPIRKTLGWAKKVQRGPVKSFGLSGKTPSHVLRFMNKNASISDSKLPNSERIMSRCFVQFLIVPLHTACTGHFDAFDSGTYRLGFLSPDQPCLLTTSHVIMGHKEPFSKQRGRQTLASSICCFFFYISGFVRFFFSKCVCAPSISSSLYSCRRPELDSCETTSQWPSVGFSFSVPSRRLGESRGLVAWGVVGGLGCHPEKGQSAKLGLV